MEHVEVKNYDSRSIGGMVIGEREKLDELGAKSGVAQELRGPITSWMLMGEEVRGGGGS